jgi:2-polyprenyl-3-methyl-5-hydroxy-6-metoxy-1,4-benzoquinol methylase
MNSAFSDPRKQRAIDIHSLQAAEFAASYDDMSSDAYRTCFTYSRKRLDVLIQSYLPARGDGLRVLDVGCGTGHYMARLRDRGFDVAGVDGSQEMLVHARDNNPESRLECADVERIPFDGGQFDYVICIEVLRYLPNISGLISEMYRLLKPGAAALATAASPLNLNGYCLINRIASSYRVRGLVPLRQYFHSSRRLRRGFLESGFDEFTIHGVYLGPINWIEHAAPRALPGLLRLWEPADARIADLPLLREFSNMYLVKAVRGR